MYIYFYYFYVIIISSTFYFFLSEVHTGDVMITVFMH